MIECSQKKMKRDNYKVFKTTLSSISTWKTIYLSLILIFEQATQYHAFYFPYQTTIHPNHGIHSTTNNHKPILKPLDSTTLFNSDIETVIKSKSLSPPARKEKSIAMLRHMERLYASGHVAARPNRETFLLVLHAMARHAKYTNVHWKRSTRKDERPEQELPWGMAQSAIGLHDQLIGSSEEDVACRPNTESYNALLNVLSNCCDRDVPTTEMVAEKASQILNTMISSEVEMQPNVTSFELVIRAWSRCSSTTASENRAADKAQQWLSKLEQLYKNTTDTESNRFQPSVSCYNFAIDAIARSGKQGSGYLAHSILQNMKLFDITPDVGTYIPTILALSRTGHERNAARRANDYLYELIQIYGNEDTSEPISVIPFNAAITAWSKSHEVDAGERAERILSLMQRLSQSAKFQSLAPQTLTYNAVITSYSKSRGSGVLSAAERLFQEMQRTPEIKPDLYTYNIMLDLYKKQKAPDRAEQLLRTMQSKYQNGEDTLKPNVFHFSTVISAWSRQNNRDSVYRPLALLNWMKSLHLEPDVVLYTLCMESFARSHHPDAVPQAKLLLKAMDLHAETNRRIVPNMRTYTAYIRTLADSRMEGSAEEALRILSKMKTLADSGFHDAKPNIYTYNYLIKACANEPVPDSFISHNKDVLSIAISAFKEMCALGHGPDSFTYAFLLKAFTNLVPSGKERDDLVMRTFRRCCRDGQVSDEVLYGLKRACSSLDKHRELLGVAVGKDVTDLPLEWSCNASRSKKR